jgi:hypothetical protein
MGYGVHISDSCGFWRFSRGIPPMQVRQGFVVISHYDIKAATLSRHETSNY